MNIYENYISELLNEDKPIGAKNRELWQNYLEKRYMSRDDIGDFFVTFVSEDKVGINPKSIYDTPNGVYTYPVAWVLDNQIPFRGREKPKKVKVLKITSKKVLSNNLSKIEYQEKIKQLQKEYGLPDKQIDSWVEDAKVQTYFGKIWNVTRSIAKNLKKEKTSNIWSTILLHLGYDVVIDNGDGVIHTNEKTQAVFLSPKSYKLVGEEFVDTEERYKTLNSNNLGIDFLDKFFTNESLENKYNFLRTHADKINKTKYDKKDFMKLSHLLLIFIFNSGFDEKHMQILFNSCIDILKKYFYGLDKHNYPFMSSILKNNYKQVFEIIDDNLDGYLEKKIYLSLADYDFSFETFEITQEDILDPNTGVYRQIILNLLLNKKLDSFDEFSSEFLKTIYSTHKTLLKHMYKEYKKDDSFYMPEKLLKIIEKDS